MIVLKTIKLQIVRRNFLIEKTIFYIVISMIQRVTGRGAMTGVNKTNPNHMQIHDNTHMFNNIVLQEIMVFETS